MARETIHVSNSTELTAALARSTGGETILLAAGDYGVLDLKGSSRFDLSFSSEVTIASADPANKAVISGMTLRNASNITFDGLVFDYTWSAADTISTRSVYVRDAENLTFRNSVFDGDLAGAGSSSTRGFATGIGLAVTDSKNVTVENNEFFEFHRGLVIGDTDDIVVRGNDVHSMRSDGMNFAGVQGVTIEDNKFHDFVASYTSTDHRDFIQFWTTGKTRPNTDIVIRDNVFDIGSGSWTQTIFMTNEAVNNEGAGREMYYRNILIEGNAIYNSHPLGISIPESIGVTIRNNTLVQVAGDRPERDLSTGKWLPLIWVDRDSETVRVQNNVTGQSLGVIVEGYSGQSGWRVTGNFVIQNNNPEANGYYGNVFVLSSLVPDENGLHHYVVLPGSVIESRGLGSPALLFQGQSDDLRALFSTAGEHMLRVFDASMTTDADGIVGARDAEFIWNFGDGTLARGRTIGHEYEKGGYYDVSLTVVRGDGSYSTTSVTIGVAGPEVLEFDRATGSFRAHSYGTETAIGLSTRKIAQTSEGAVLKISGTGSVLDIPRAYLGELYGASGIDLSLRLKGDGSAGNRGDVLRVNNAFIVTVDHRGDLVFRLVTSAGETKLTSTGVNMNDGRVHDIRLVYDGEDGIAQIMIDGAVVASARASGTMTTAANWDLTFGNSWSARNFVSELSGFALDVTPAVGLSYNGLMSDDAAARVVSSGTPAATVPPAEAVDDTPAPPPVETPQEEAEETPDGADILLDLAGILSSSASAPTEAGALVTGGTGVVASVSRHMLTDFFGADGFGLEMTLQSTDPARARAEVVRIGTALQLYVETDGNLILRVYTQGDTVYLKTKGFNLRDGAEHDIGIQYDSHAARIVVMIDGTEAQSSALTGPLAAMNSTDLTFGNPWSSGLNFEGLIRDFALTAGVPDASPAVASRMAVAETPALFVEETAVSLDAGDAVSLDSLPDFAASTRLGLSVSFTRDVVSSETVQLIGSAPNVTLELAGDGLVVSVATAGARQAEFAVDHLEFGTGGEDEVTVLVDTDEDRLQVIVNDILVLEETGTDFWFGSDPGANWTLGGATETGTGFDGTIRRYSLYDDFDFATADPETLLI